MIGVVQPESFTATFTLPSRVSAKAAWMQPRINAYSLSVYFPLSPPFLFLSQWIPEGTFPCQNTRLCEERRECTEPLMRTKLESKTSGWGEPSSLPPPPPRRGTLGGSAGGGGLGAGCPDLSGSPTRLLQLPCLFKAGCRKGSRTAFIMQITRVNGQIPRWALEWNAELLAAGRGG